MTHEEVIHMIETYRQNVGRVEHLENALRVCSNYLDNAGDGVEQIVGSAQVITGMPHGTKTSDPTSRIALMLADGYIPEIVKDAKEEMARIKAELAEKRPAIVFVRAWLKGLSDKECWMIEGKMINGKSWEELRLEHMHTYHIQCSKATLKRLKSTALEKIFEMAR